MKDIIFVTGNEHKAHYVRQWLDLPIQYQALDIPEIQSLDLQAVVQAKAVHAHELLRQTVLVEDVALTFKSLGKLPGTFVKWFLQEIGSDGLCKLLNDKADRSAIAEIVYGLHDGKRIHYFSGVVRGSIAPSPRGSFGFGWNSIFIPEGQSKTYAEMTDDELRPYSQRAHALEKLKQFLVA